MRSETMAGLGETRSYGRQSQAGEAQDLHVGREEGERLGQARHAGVVAVDV